MPEKETRTINFTPAKRDRNKFARLRSDHVGANTLALEKSTRIVCRDICPTEIHFRCNPEYTLSGDQVVVIGDINNGVIGTNNCAVYIQGVTIELRPKL